MPRSYSADETRRQTVDLHAPWWSPKMTHDGTLDTEVISEGGRYVERWVVYAQRLHVDDEAVDQRIYGKVKTPSRAGETIKMDTAKAPAYLLQQMTVEVTDETGTPAPLVNITGKRPMLTESYLRGVPERDLDFVIGELSKMKEPPVPVTEADEREADERAVAHANAEAHGVPMDRPDRLPSSLQLRTPEEVAQDRFRPTRPTAVYGADADA
jgi:hypothetical protein